MRQITDGAMCRKRGSSAASLRLASVFDVLSRGFLGGRGGRGRRTWEGRKEVVRMLRKLSKCHVVSSPPAKQITPADDYKASRDRAVLGANSRKFGTRGYLHCSSQDIHLEAFSFCSTNTESLLFAVWDWLDCYDTVWAARSLSCCHN